MGKNTPRLPRKKNILFSGKDLTELDYYATLAKVDLETYLVYCGLSYPHVLKELEALDKRVVELEEKYEPEAAAKRLEETENKASESKETVSAGAGEAASGASGDGTARRQDGEPESR